MAPVYDFRHVELDKIGRGKRIVKPPGGECSDIFGVQGGSPSQNGQTTPRKMNNYMQSTIFSSNGVSTPNGHTPSPYKRMEDTQCRLFGSSSEGEDTPRKVIDRQKSKIFEDEPDSGIFSPKTTPVRNTINPITGSPMYENGTPITNGTNGYSNGIANGHSSPGHSPPMLRVRNPPGGKSSGIF